MFESVSSSRKTRIHRCFLGLCLLVAHRWSGASEPFTLECQALVSVWRSEIREQVRIENFNLMIHQTPNVTRVSVSGNTRIQLDSVVTDKGNGEVQQTTELNKPELHVEKISRAISAKSLQVLRVNAASGKLRFHSWESPDVLTSAQGKCQTPWLILEALDAPVENLPSAE